MIVLFAVGCHHAPPAPPADAGLDLVVVPPAAAGCVLWDISEPAGPEKMEGASTRYPATGCTYRATFHYSAGHAEVAVDPGGEVARRSGDPLGVRQVELSLELEATHGRWRVQWTDADLRPLGVISPDGRTLDLSDVGAALVGLQLCEGGVCMAYATRVRDSNRPLNPDHCDAWKNVPCVPGADGQGCVRALQDEWGPGSAGFVAHAAGCSETNRGVVGVLYRRQAGLDLDLVVAPNNAGGQNPFSLRTKTGVQLGASAPVTALAIDLYKGGTTRSR